PHRTRKRTWLALALGAAGLTALTVGLNGNRGPASLTTAALLYLVPVVVLAVIGGVWPALAAALASDALLNWFFVPPYHTFTVENRENVLALLIYVLVAVTVSLAVDLAARQRAAAVRSGLEARLLARITAAPVADQSLTRLLGHIRDTFAMRAVALVEGDETVAVVGTPGAADPALAGAAAGGGTVRAGPAGRAGRGGVPGGAALAGAHRGRRRPAARAGRSGAAGTGGGQPGEQRGARVGLGHRRRQRRTVHCGPAGGGPRRRGAGRGPGPDVRAVPAAGRPHRRRRARAGPGHRTRVHRGDGRPAHAGRHPGRRPDHDGHPAAGRFMSAAGRGAVWTQARSARGRRRTKAPRGATRWS